VAQERKQQAVGVIHAGAVELAMCQARQLFDLRCPEIIPADRLDNLVVSARPVYSRIFIARSGQSGCG
jgi:hypothetical protein